MEKTDLFCLIYTYKRKKFFVYNLGLETKISAYIGNKYKKIGLRNQPSVTQSEWIHCACAVETTTSLV